jgi:short-subunit dehydrogenase
MRTIAIFGAGPALGRATAHRFGKDGFRVALVARDRDRLDDLVRELDAAGVEAAGFPGDLSDVAAAPHLVDAIEHRLGPIDVLAYGPTPNTNVLGGASGIDVATASGLLDMFVLAPVALVRRVLPGMLERGDGALLFALGGSAKYPQPHVAAGGLALAGLYNYALTLHADLAPSHVYAGALLIGALIEGSAAHRQAAEWSVDGHAPSVVAPADLAEHLWDMYTRRDRAEDEVIPRRDARDDADAR